MNAAQEMCERKVLDLLFNHFIGWANCPTFIAITSSFIKLSRPENRSDLSVLKSETIIWPTATVIYVTRRKPLLLVEARWSVWLKDCKALRRFLAEFSGVSINLFDDGVVLERGGVDGGFARVFRVAELYARVSTWHLEERVHSNAQRNGLWHNSHFICMNQIRLKWTIFRSSNSKNGILRKNK